MRKHIGFVLASALLGLGLTIPSVSATVTPFDAPKGSAAFFDGRDEHFLTFTNSPYLNMGGDTFTISWWQQTTSYQFRFPRIMQFGAGPNHSDSWAISEENDGNIYLWINGINITSMPIPGMFDWHHIALTRTGDTFRWFLNGNYVSETIFTPGIPCDGCLTRLADFTTTTLNLLIGGGDDPNTGAFIGKIAGFQISKSLRWAGTTTFTPPTNFQNPESGLVFSMYGDQSEIADRSTNLLAATNPGITVTDFDPPVTAPTPDPSPSPSPSDSPSPSPDPSPSPSDSPSPTPDPSPSPSDSPSPTPDPDLPRYEVSVSVWRAQGGKVTYQTESDTEYSNVPDTSYEFWVEGPEALQINLIPARGYAMDYIIWNGEKISDPTSWNDSASFIGYDNLIGNITIRVHFKLVRIVSIIEALTENDFPYFDQDIIIKSPNPDHPNNYWGIDGIVMSVPISLMEPGGQRRSIECFMNIDPFWNSNSSMNYSEIEISLIDFGRFIHEFFPSDCETTRSEAFPEGEEIPNYLPGMLGQESVTVTFSLFSKFPDDITNLSTALETLTVTLGLPPDILSYTITSANPEYVKPNSIYFGDTLTVSPSNIAEEGFAVMGVSLPEATSIPSTEDPTICFINFMINESNSYRLPSEQEFMTACRLKWNGEWELDRQSDHFFGFFYADTRENAGYPLQLSIPALEVIAPTPPAPTPPAPTPPAPTPPAPTPPAPLAVVEVIAIETPIFETPTAVVEPDVVAIPEIVIPLEGEKGAQALYVSKDSEKPIAPVRKQCNAAGIWVYTKSGRLQICDSNKKTVLDIKACTGKSATPTYPWTFRAYRFKPGYMTAQSGLKMYYSVFFYKSLSITGVESVSSKPCSHGSVFIEKKYAKTVYQYALKQKPVIWVRNK